MAQKSSTLPTPEEVTRSYRLVIAGTLISLLGGMGATLIGQYLAGAVVVAAGTAIVIFGGAAADEHFWARVTSSMTPGTSIRRRYTLRWVFALLSSLMAFGVAAIASVEQHDYYMIPIALVIVGVTAARMMKYSETFIDAPPAEA